MAVTQVFSFAKHGKNLLRVSVPLKANIVLFRSLPFNVQCHFSMMRLNSFLRLNELAINSDLEQSVFCRENKFL